jgi:RNA polymerase sigma factor (sigma-70 family)
VAVRAFVFGACPLEISEQLISQLRKYIVRLAPQLGIRGEDVEDLKQEALVTTCMLLRSKPQVSVGLLYHVIRKRAIDYSRKYFNTKKREYPLLSCEVVLVDSDLHEQVQKRIDMEMLLNELGDSCAQLLMMRQAGMSSQERGELLGLSSSAVFGRERRARKKLKKAFV